MLVGFFCCVGCECFWLWCYEFVDGCYVDCYGLVWFVFC